MSRSKWQATLDFANSTKAVTISFHSLLIRTMIENVFTSSLPLGTPSSAAPRHFSAMLHAETPASFFPLITTALTKLLTSALSSIVWIPDHFGVVTVSCNLLLEGWEVSYLLRGGVYRGVWKQARLQARLFSIALWISRMLGMTDLTARSQRVSPPTSAVGWNGPSSII
ncbi:uncharacterized protein BDCG_09352 [Blastomyces dermatitidis ER-3]|nr:uncharacterized protein BDCG_09352 [Blastomyces dermatitidis ER-3]EEQ86083.2 hypothetical protein BDCG_09352 [Blastomyces dermatitidis ER-3]EQL30981.1 hypothetical protein BDFG_06614 [Blastomyces dermatitidis ATCC 26199]